MNDLDKTHFKNQDDGFGVSSEGRSRIEMMKYQQDRQISHIANRAEKFGEDVEEIFTLALPKKRRKKKRFSLKKLKFWKKQAPSNE